MLFKNILDEEENEIVLNDTDSYVWSKENASAFGFPHSISTSYNKSGLV